MQIERRSHQTPQEVQMVRLVPEQAFSAMQQAMMQMLQTLPLPITIRQQQDQHHQTYYTYQVGEPTEQQPIGIAMGATPDFLDAMRFSLEAAMQHSTQAQGGGVPLV